MRIRQRPGEFKIYRNPSTLLATIPNVIESITDSPVGRGWKPVTHLKYTSFQSGTYAKNHSISGQGTLMSEQALNFAFATAAKANIIAPEFQANDSFELIPFLYEWKDTIEMFSAKFVKSLASPQGYGAFTWGITPFISDVKALIQSVRDIASGIPDAYSEQVENSADISASLKAQDSPWPHHEVSVRGTARYNGIYSFTPPKPPIKNLDRALHLLDELGVHPDLKTVWDLIPFSFVVDYFLPIGDLIESLNPRGWANYSGTFSGALTLDLEVSHTAGTGSLTTWPLVSGNRAEFKYYSRGTAHELPVVSLGLSDQPELEVPSARNLLNTAYLAMSSIFASRSGKS